MFDALKAAALPEHLSIGNHPNPFNAAATFKIGLPEDSDVQLIIFDLRGRQVTKLIDGNRPAGWHEVRWNSGAAASGVYFYTLKVRGEILRGKMLLLK